LRVPSGRVGFLDEVRGIDLLVMAFYHAVYDLVFIFGVSIPAFQGPVFGYMQFCIASVFIVISGACCRYSRSNFRRGLQTLAVGLCMSLVTWLFIPSQFILFGILHFMGCAMMLYALLQLLLHRIPPLLGIPLMLLLFLLTRGVSSGFVGLGAYTVPLPAALWQVSFLFPLGIMGPGFVSADYFPLFPWLFLFFAGSYLGTLFQQGKMPRALYRTHLPFFAALGRHSLLFYVLHQPVIYGILTLYFRYFRHFRLMG